MIIRMQQQMMGQVIFFTVILAMESEEVTVIYDSKTLKHTLKKLIKRNYNETHGANNS